MKKNFSIQVRQISKRYRIGELENKRPTLAESIVASFSSPLRNYRRLRDLSKFDGNSRDAGNVIWALQSVSFDAKQGEVIGLIGRNGSGKSTLLKILSSITHPTAGRVELTGKVASLLEVGTGFHSELTGRENVYLNGTILGMTKKDIDRHFDEIVEFAGLAKFIDTPVKRYSSGMGTRLAFSVAAHLQPDILLIDEVLAVGDVEFQRKSVGKMEDISRSGGRTVIFVSHNMALIESLCERTILLQKGEIVADGPTKQVIQKYLQSLESLNKIDLSMRKDRKGTGEIIITNVSLLDPQMNEVDSVRSGEDFKLAIDFQVAAKSSQLNGVIFGVSVLQRGTPMFNLSSNFVGKIFNKLPRQGRIICDIPKNPLSPGSYQFNVECFVRKNLADRLSEAGRINVVEGDFFGTGVLPPMESSGLLINHSWDIV